MSQVTLNKEKMKPIFEVTILCRKQNIALRGHRHDAKYCDEAGFNPGNLHSILNYLTTRGREELSYGSFINRPKRATYRTKRTQNELINIYGDVVSSTIINEIQKAKYFLIMADEAADITKWSNSQFSLFTRCAMHSGRWSQNLSCVSLAFNMDDFTLNLKRYIYSIKLLT